MLLRLERENAELRQRLRDVGSLLGKTKLAEYMEKNNVGRDNVGEEIHVFVQIKELVLVGEREILDNQESQENSSEDNQDASKDAVYVTCTS